MNSPTPIISVKSISYGYSKKQNVLEQLNLSVPRASIYGFLGPNGAGKSTTIRTILGLLQPQEGSVELFGKKLADHRLEILRDIGSLIEEPSIYKHLSGYDNLRIASKYLNLPTNRIEEVLELVNLQKHSQKKAGNYSTGMKQRLGLAIALLSDPELLILDEPVNGLDPNGIIEIRDIIKKLNESGKTILLSSHHLPEIEKIATQVGILKDGKMIFEGTIEELEKLRINDHKVKMVISDVEQTAALLKDRFKVEILDKETVIVELGDPDLLPGIIEELVAKQIKLFNASPYKRDLENLFIDLTNAN